MHPYMYSEIARGHQAEIRRQAKQARLARSVLDPFRPKPRIKLSGFRRPILSLFGLGGTEVRWSMGGASYAGD